ncbi:MAG TPA: hypothetical protein VGH52_03995 [Gaiellaceae bacterium]|jgi:hypothetical protein
MAAPKKLTPQQARDRRSKIALAALGVVFVAVLGFELPGMLGGGGGTPAAAPTTSSTAVSTPAATPSASAVSYQVVAAAQPGQLTKFSNLHPKNPFQPLVSAGPAGGGGVTTAQAGSTTPAKGSNPSVVLVIPKQQVTTPQGPLVLAAALKLNGHGRVIAVGDSFPQVNPVFKLIAVSKDAIWIQLIGGSLASGDTTLKIKKGQPVKLVNQTAGIDYVIRLVRVKTIHQPLQSVTPTTTTAATTTSSTTTSSTTTTTADGTPSP